MALKCNCVTARRDFDNESAGRRQARLLYKGSQLLPNGHMQPAAAPQGRRAKNRWPLSKIGSTNPKGHLSPALLPTMHPVKQSRLCTELEKRLKASELEKSCARYALAFLERNGFTVERIYAGTFLSSLIWRESQFQFWASTTVGCPGSTRRLPP
jgi:hypothetical protein